MVGHMLGAGRLTIPSSRTRFAGRLKSGVRPHMASLLRSYIALSSGWTTAMVASLVCSIAVFPEHLIRPMLSDLSHLSLSGALDGAAVPLLVTWIASFRYALSPRAAMFTSAGVALPILSWQLFDVWHHYGAFPNHMPQLQLLVLLPTCLASGYAFGYVLHRVGPNNSFKPTPLRGAA